MNKLITTLLIFIILGSFSCDQSQPVTTEIIQNESDTFPPYKGGDLSDTISTYKKYEVKSGIITFETSMNTLTVNLKFKTIISFDNYGIKERRDTYDGEELTETFLCDGRYNYNISHKQKRIVRTGRAYHGTESKFGWDGISKEDLASGKVIKNPPIIIADKKCQSYTINTGAATATYAGWKNIVLLNKIESKGGKSLAIAVKVQISTVNDSTFGFPKGYQKKG